MSNIIESMERLVNELSKLPSCGKKTAQRYAYYLIKADQQVVDNLQTAITEAKTKIHYCSNPNFKIIKFDFYSSNQQQNQQKPVD